MLVHYLLPETHKELKRVMRAHSVQTIQFCQVPYLETQRICTRMIYIPNDTCKKIFGFAVSHLNFDLNAVNYSQKLKKFIKSIQVKFSGPLNDDDSEEFNQI